MKAVELAANFGAAAGVSPAQSPASSYEGNQNSDSASPCLRRQAPRRDEQRRGFIPSHPAANRNARPPRPTSSHSLRSAAAALILLAAAIAPLRACYGPELASVHFHTFRPDFLRMPQRWRGVPAEKRALSRTALRWVPDSYEDAPDVTDLETKLPKRALDLEARGEFHPAADTWQRYAAYLRSDPAPNYEPDSAVPQLRGLEERIPLLRLWHSRQDTAPLRELLAAREALSRGASAKAEPHLRTVTSPRFAWHRDYLRAVVLFEHRSAKTAAAAFRALAKREPDSVLARYMVGRCYFRPIAATEVPEDNDPDTKRKPRPKLDPAEREHLLRNALNAYEWAATAAGNDPLIEDARGMVAACRFRLGHRAAALHTYLERLAKLPPGQSDPGAWVSARNCLRAMTDGDHLAFQKLALDQPALVAAYLDMQLHYGKHSVLPNHHLGDFALQVLRRHPTGAISGQLQIRLAMLEERSGRYAEAERLSAAALKSLPAGADQDQARWQHALALHQRHRDPAALAEFERLAGHAQLEKMRRGAREAAAVLYERNDNRVEALRHYFALDYRPDYGYLLDCQMSPAEIRTFLRRYPRHPRARLIRYSLSYRQLRAGDYAAAARGFASLGAWLRVAEKQYDSRTYREKKRMPALQVALRLAALRTEEHRAKRPSRKARAAYAAAALMFHQRHLIFYNPALWRGTRTWSFDLNKPYNLVTRQDKLWREEQGKLDRYEREHTALAQAAAQFERIAREYPHTREAPRALYSAALSLTLTPHVESYWTNHNVEFERRAIRLYHRIVREYPHDPLAPAALKWGGPLPSGSERRRLGSPGAG